MDNPNGRGINSTRRKTWTTEHEEILFRLYPTTDTKEIAAQLDRSISSIENKARKHKLLKAENYVHPGQKKVGDTPWNKGLHYEIKGNEATRFQPGNMPASARAYAYYDGQVVSKRHKDGSHYLFRRISKGKWITSHRYNWEQLHGPIPKGMLLRCKSDDTLNDDPNNWELLTRKEHAARNHVGVENTAAKRLTPGFVAAALTKGRPELRPLVLENPELIEAHRLYLTLNRVIKDVTTQRTTNRPC